MGRRTQSMEVNLERGREFSSGVSTLLHSLLCLQGNVIPVFLGSDVVSQTGIRTENHPKLHAKFARKGLATRLNFSTEFKFEKLRLPSGLNNLWFYSIQGLFKVAFDLYSREEQLAVIESLQELWKSRLKDEPLNKCYDLSTCLENSRSVVPVCNQAEEPKIHDNRVVSTSQQISGIPRSRCSLSEHNYCMSQEDKSGACLSQETAGNDLIIQRIKSLLGMCSSSVLHLEDQLMKTIVALLDVVGQVFSQHNCLDKMINSILELLEVVSHLQDNPQQASTVYDNHLLFEVSSWLGNRFHSENDRISQQVEEFKRKHIERISDLPPAEELVAALFPNAMKVLLLKWMGLLGDASVSKLQSEYPILLLILEFANHNLITGVSHVLYSSLICK
ncbi:hypothetical protein GDO78_007473 [Eleutherodactylus coqui]|uniref:Uncharacterized protein n=1 Tax=Eleutherodactylus coqui TaxID=57060 RepID=A0A8J6FH01_ELECQ|nr:hypothetical protein GDO78_007473 [Eleutherodactylus coqui]